MLENYKICISCGYNIQNYKDNKDFFEETISKNRKNININIQCPICESDINISICRPLFGTIERPKKSQEIPIRRQSKFEYWRKKIRKDGLPSGGNINEWGSCQYHTAKLIYDLYFEIRKDLSKEETLEVLDIKYNIVKIHQFKDIKHTLIYDNIYKLNILNNQNDYIGLEYESEYLKGLSSAETVDDWFNVLKKNAYDLWTAAGIAESHLFEIDNKDIPESVGFGPIWNQTVQKQNYTTGLVCALLVDYGLIKDESSFTDFDT